MRQRLVFAALLALAGPALGQTTDPGAFSTNQAVGGAPLGATLEGRGNVTGTGIVGPAGPPGPVGPMGPQGPQGPAGAGGALTAATASTLGGIKCGTGLVCAGDGTASVDSQVPAAAASVPALADLKVLLQDGTYLTGSQLKSVLGVP